MIPLSIAPASLAVTGLATQMQYVGKRGQCRKHTSNSRTVSRASGSACSAVRWSRLRLSAFFNEQRRGGRIVGNSDFVSTPRPKRAIGFELTLVKWSLGASTQAVVVRPALVGTPELGQGSRCASDAAEARSVGQRALGWDTSRA
jgi:hypothetical protein